MSLQAALAIANIVTTLFGTFANGFDIMAYYRNPRLRTIQNTIFLLLAITGIGVTAFAQLIFVFAILSGLLVNYIVAFHSSYIIVLVLGTIAGSNCYSQRAKLYNLDLSVSLPKYNYKVLFEFILFVFSWLFHFATNPGYCVVYTEGMVLLP
jgi:hypothetical protein